MTRTIVFLVGILAFAPVAMAQIDPATPSSGEREASEQQPRGQDGDRQDYQLRSQDEDEQGPSERDLKLTLDRLLHVQRIRGGVMQTYDTNRNSYVDPDEIPTALPALRQLQQFAEQSGMGLAGPKEPQVGAQERWPRYEISDAYIERFVKRFDLNENGKLDAKEIQTVQHEVRKYGSFIVQLMFDYDKDGKLNPEELRIAEQAMLGSDDPEQPQD